jgi:hypothetical protein
VIFELQEGALVEGAGEPERSGSGDLVFEDLRRLQIFRFV